MALTLLVVAGTRPERYSIPSIIVFACVIGLGLAMIVWRRNRWERADARRPRRPPAGRMSTEPQPGSDEGLRAQDVPPDEPTEPGTR